MEGFYLFIYLFIYCFMKNVPVQCSNAYHPPENYPK